MSTNDINDQKTEGQHEEFAEAEQMMPETSVTAEEVKPAPAKEVKKGSVFSKIMGPWRWFQHKNRVEQIIISLIAAGIVSIGGYVYTYHIAPHFAPYWSNRDNIFEAAQYGTDEDVKFFLRSGMEVNVRDATEEGWTPLHYAAAYNENDAAVKLLVSNGADVNAKNNGDTTPLHSAASNQNVKIVEYLLLGIPLTPVPTMACVQATHSVSSAEFASRSRAGGKTASLVERPCGD